MMKKWKLGLSILPCLLLAGCTNQVSVYTFVNRKILPNGFSPEKTFYVHLPEKFAGIKLMLKVEKALKAKGFVVVADKSKADYFVKFDVSMKKEKAIVNRSVYIPGEYRVTTGDIGGVPYRQSAYSSGTTICVPQLCTFYAKSLFLHVYEKKGWFDKEAAVWAGFSIIVEEGDSNLDKSLDYLLIALFGDFGKVTQKDKKVKTSQLEKDVKALRQEYGVPFRQVKLRWSKKRRAKKYGGKRWVVSSYLPKK